MDLFRGIPAAEAMPGVLYLLAFLALAIGAPITLWRELTK